MAFTEKKNILLSGKTADGPVVSTELYFSFSPPMGLFKEL